jgi:soluble lytic murein transglycosylase
MPLLRPFLVLASLSSAPATPPDEANIPPMDVEIQAPSINETPEEADFPASYVEVVNPLFPPPQPMSLKPRRLYGPADLAPYFAEGPLAEAHAAFERAAYGRTLALTRGSGAESLPVRYLRAQAALRAREFTLAADELTELARSYPAVADRCLWGAAQAREALGQLDVATDLLGQVPAHSRMWVDARLSLARLLVQQKQRARAAEVLDALTQLGPLSGRDVGAEALWARADLARKEGKRAVEREALTRLWALHPISPLAARAEVRLGSAPSAPEAIADRAEVLVEAHRNRQGLKLLEPLVSKLTLPDPLACRAQFILGKALRKERAHTRAIQVLEPVAAKCTGELRPRALYVLGTSQSIVAPERGIRTYETLAKEFPDHPFADDALFYAADLEVKVERLEAALDRIAALVQRYPSGDFTPEALFKAFWIQRRLKRHGDAAATLADIQRRYADAEESYEVERARYWRARLTEETGDRTAAADLMGELALEHPATYYGLRAREWLAHNDEKRLANLQPQLIFGAVSAAVWPLDSGPLEDDPHFQSGVEHLRLGMGDVASSELLAVKRTGASAESLRLLVRLLSQAGDARSAHAIARTALRRDLQGRVTPETRPIWEIAYPVAFRPMIEKHCKGAGIDPDLLQALMREESALDPHALSWAGALGLTQLMPSTARSVARALKIRVPAVAKLLDPDVNIHLGAAYLSQLLKHHQGDASFALASYNAGANAVDRWRQAGVDLPLDAWVEEIPLAETRGYVKRVLRSYNTYRLLYGVQAGAAPGAAVATDQR